MENLTTSQSDIRSLAHELQSLREKLEKETSTLKQREEYSPERRIDGIRAEIAEKEDLLDQIQGREADENRKWKAQQNFERAGRQLAESQGELQRLRAEYSALPGKIRQAEWNFNQALREFNMAKEAKTTADGK
jgi:chromosome segregation ATPase